MRFKLFVVCALACGFMAFVLANENVSTEVEDQVKKVATANKSPKIDEAVELVELLEEVVPKAPAPSPPAVKKANKPPVVPVQESQKPAIRVEQPKEVQLAGKLLPVASSRGTDDILTVAGLKPQPKSGALVMPHEDYYMAELYDVDANGVNWGK